MSPKIPAPLLPPPVLGVASVEDAADRVPREIKVTTAPSAPSALAPKSTEALVPTSKPGEDVVAAVNLQQVALPAFIQILYAEVLKKTVNLHPAVTSRQDLVTFRTGGGQSAEQLELAVRLLLKSYGLSAIEVGGLVRVLPDNAALGDLPSIRYGAARPDTPLPLRPVFHLVQLESVRQTDVTNWLRTMFGERVKVQEDAGRNAVLISGNPDNVKAALEAINALDQPAMKGRASMALAPAYWSSDELARRLADLLGAEGYAVQPVGQPITPGASRFPVILLPISALNSVYVFASSDAVLEHVANWARTLDKPNERGIGKNFFSYTVKHKDAELLAQTLDRVLSGTRGTANSGTVQTPASGQAQTPATTKLASVVVDKSTNMLIFQANPDEYGQIISLLQTLDRPTKAALIEVTVAELALNDSSQLGVEWLATHAMNSGAQIIGGTSGGLAIGSAGATFRVLDTVGGVRAVLNALASNNRATILSSPRVMARNGETATIQVGQEVPIITSQQSTGVAPGTNNSGLLQTVQYRSTGVILKVKPVIHSGDQVDLDVTQEVSQALATETGVSSSPTFTTRKVDTKLTLKNGTTVLLGGLISEDSSQGSAGIPFLKDIPVIGGLFSKQTGSGGRRELIVLITPYIANDSHDAESITEAFRKSLGSWAGKAAPGEKIGSPYSSTVMPAPPASAPGNEGVAR
ncbi:secretin N-terminal domain-containing protein [Paucibacter sp. DJ2R-2]|uniref:secretin N-terminal domain-containing protein n=1 Tax=Paucibacter sp. DJ2R-2 TaxID=2893558 RepID=UPI0021E4B342|nr:secretin N-terminal domain-containing protein [Paucibacter sp. DJ2R-2]MCV2423118.1 hypothetical protein [Paucibacter sp. DJ4R-1]MCV2441013.1 hypothetical protein [Paucibacter sp. DJ2R-2]